MFNPLLLPLLLLFTLTPALPLPLLSRRDADFETVRTNLLISNSDLSLSPSTSRKYFHESTFSGHQDGRFAAALISPLDRAPHLTALIRSYLAFTLSIGAETWLMHGSLLGWYWSRTIMPWDSDVDVMTSEKSMDFLAGFHNMTVHYYQFKGERERRSYLLEVNPNWKNGTVDPENKIDARWIDRDTGLFIDITTVRRNLTARASGEDVDALMVKDGHHYGYDDIWPLRDSVFEGVPVRVPFAYPEILAEEYGEEALAMARFGGYRFDVEGQRWLAIEGEEEGRSAGRGPTVWQWLTGG